MEEVHNFFEKTAKPVNEEELAKFIRMLSEACELAVKSSSTRYLVTDKLRPVITTYFDSLKVDWARVWSYLDESTYAGYTGRVVFEYIMQKIDFKTFAKKVNQNDDLVLVSNLYSTFFDVNKMPLDEMMDKYRSYLDETIRRNDYSYKELLNEYVDKYYYAEGPTWVDSNTEMVLCMLLDKANIDYVVGATEKDTLKAKLALGIVKTYPMVVTRDVVRNLMKKTSDLYFTDGKGNTTDKCELNFLNEDNEEAMRIFNSPEFNLYDDTQYDLLMRDTGYDSGKYGRPVDRLVNACDLLGVTEEAIILKLVCNDKVELIGADFLLNKLKGCLRRENYRFVLDYIQGKNIPIYLEQFTSRNAEVIMCTNEINTFYYNAVMKTADEDINRTRKKK